MLDAYIYDGARTPFGRHAESLSKVRPDDMLASVIKEVVGRSSFEASSIDDVNVGCASQAGEDSRCIARHSILLAGLPIDVPGAVFQRNCGSGLNAIISSAHAITCGEGDVFLAGGVESMTRAPFVVGKSEQAFGKDFKVFDSAIGARFPNPKIEKQFGADSMPETADNLARDFQISREDCDAYAIKSQQSYAKAKADGFFAGELSAITIPGTRGKPDVVITEDEHPRPETTLDGLKKLRPLFEGGVTTAGNASGINDGAVALLLASRKAGDKAGAKPIARIVSSGVAGVPPRTMGFGPVPAAKKALERAGLDIKDMDVIEINEAFAAQVLPSADDLGMDFDKLNVHGGAIALGHPFGSTGTRIMTTLLNGLQARDGQFGLETMCVGGGQGMAIIVERLS